MSLFIQKRRSKAGTFYIPPASEHITGIVSPDNPDEDIRHHGVPEEDVPLRVLFRRQRRNDTRLLQDLSSEESGLFTKLFGLIPGIRQLGGVYTKPADVIRCPRCGKDVEGSKTLRVKARDISGAIKPIDICDREKNPSCRDETGFEQRYSYK